MGSFAFYQKSFITATSRSQGHVPNVIQEFLCINCCDISQHLVSYTLNVLSCEDSRRPEHTEEDPDDPKPTAEGYIQMVYSCD